MTGRKNSALIRVSKETWKEINARKEVGDTFDSVLKRVLEIDSKEGK
jgi:hypothetical protein